LPQGLNALFLLIPSRCDSEKETLLEIQVIDPDAGRSWMFNETVSSSTEHPFSLSELSHIDQMENCTWQHLSILPLSWPLYSRDMLLFVPAFRHVSVIIVSAGASNSARVR
jgi:hypothetical protein